MIMKRSNTSRYLIEREALRQLVHHQPPAVTDHIDMPLATADGHIAAAYEEIFVATDRMLDVMEVLMASAHQHFLKTYPDDREYWSGCHARASLLPVDGPLLCLTGPAGVGKSALMIRLSSVLQRMEPKVKASTYGEMPFVHAWYLQAGTRRSEALFFAALNRYAQVCAERRLAKGDAGESYGAPLELEENDQTRTLKRKGVSVLIESCKRLAFRDSVSICMVDELQFLTQSSAANALLASFLLHLKGLGIPVVFAVNYSAGHRILRRNHEDQDRIFERSPLVLLPDSPDSKGWEEIVRGYMDVLPGAFSAGADELADSLHRFSGGLMRYLGRLIRLAYKRARASGWLISRQVLAETFASSDFEYERRKVTEFLQIGSGVSTSRTDMVCPFELPESEQQAHRKVSHDARVEEVAAVLARQQLTPLERDTSDALQAAARGKPAQRSARVRPIKSSPNEMSLAELRAAEQRRQKK